MIKSLELTWTFFSQEFEFAPEIYNRLCPILSVLPDQLWSWIDYSAFMKEIYTPAIVSVFNSAVNQQSLIS